MIHHRELQLPVVTVTMLGGCCYQFWRLSLLHFLEETSVEQMVCSETGSLAQPQQLDVSHFGQCAGMYPRHCPKMHLQCAFWQKSDRQWLLCDCLPQVASVLQPSQLLM
jgi:hypothetical protein